MPSISFIWHSWLLSEKLSTENVRVDKISWFNQGRPTCSCCCTLPFPNKANSLFLFTLDTPLSLSLPPKCFRLLPPWKLLLCSLKKYTMFNLSYFLTFPYVFNINLSGAVKTQPLPIHLKHSQCHLFHNLDRFCFTI